MKRTILLAAVSLLFATMPLVAMAQVPAPQTGGGLPPPQTGGGTVPSFNQTNTVSSGGSNSLINPLGVQTICGLIKSVLSAALQIGIPIAVLFIVWAGFKFVLAQGSEEALRGAKRTLFNTIIGIAIFLGAWLLGQIIANVVNSLQQGSSNQINITACN